MSEADPAHSANPRQKKSKWRQNAGVFPLFRRDYSGEPSVRSAEGPMISFVEAIQKYIETKGAPDDENQAETGGARADADNQGGGTADDCASANGTQSEIAQQQEDVPAGEDG